MAHSTRRRVTPHAPHLPFRLHSLFFVGRLSCGWSDLREGIPHDLGSASRPAQMWLCGDSWHGDRSIRTASAAVLCWPCCWKDSITRFSVHLYDWQEHNRVRPYERAHPVQVTQSLLPAAKDRSRYPRSEEWNQWMLKIFIFTSQKPASVRESSTSTRSWKTKLPFRGLTLAHDSNLIRTRRLWTEDIEVFVCSSRWDGPANSANVRKCWLLWGRGRY